MQMNADKCRCLSLVDTDLHCTSVTPATLQLLQLLVVMDCGLWGGGGGGRVELLY